MAMAPLQIVAALAAAAALVANVAAQAGGDSNANDNVRVWAAVAYINSGERTPLLGSLQTVLTPEGAQQLWRQGSAFRDRYVTGNNTAIQNVAQDAIDNRQLTVLSQADEWVAAGALAFMQGLYPAQKGVFLDAAGGKDLSHGYANGSNDTEYPLNGYQYPKLRTLSIEERSSIGCVDLDTRDTYHVGG